MKKAAISFAAAFAATVHAQANAYVGERTVDRDVRAYCERVADRNTEYTGRTATDRAIDGVFDVLERAIEGRDVGRVALRGTRNVARGASNDTRQAVRDWNREYDRCVRSVEREERRMERERER